MTCAICLLQPTRLCRSRRTLSAVPLFSQLRPFKVLCRRLPKRLQDVLALRRVLFFGERASELCDPPCVLFEAFGQQPADLGVGVRLQLVVVDLFLLLLDWNKRSFPSRISYLFRFLFFSTNKNETFSKIHYNTHNQYAPSLSPLRPHLSQGETRRNARSDMPSDIVV